MFMPERQPIMPDCQQCLRERVYDLNDVFHFLFLSFFAETMVRKYSSDTVNEISTIEDYSRVSQLN